MQVESPPEKAYPEVDMVPKQITKTIHEPRQVTTTVMQPRQVTNTVIEDGQVQICACLVSKGVFT